MSTLPFALKAGVDPTGITQQLMSALGVAQGVYSSFGQPFTITSLTEGQHVANSMHYIGQAADLRTNGIDPSLVPQIAQSLQAQLGPQYYVLQESDHIHVQYNGVGTAPDSSSTIDTAVAPDASSLDPSSILANLGLDAGSLQSGTIDWTTIGLVGLGAFLLWYLADEFFG